MDLTHWDTVDIDFTFEQVAALACDWDPYLDQFERAPAAVAAKRAFLMDKMREGYASTLSWCISAFKRQEHDKKFDDEGYLLLPDLPLAGPWPFNVNPCVTTDIDGLWEDAKSNKDFDLPEYVKNLPPIEKQSMDRFEICAFLAALGWKGGYDFTFGLEPMVERNPLGEYEVKSPTDADDTSLDELNQKLDDLNQEIEAPKTKDEDQSAPVAATEKPLHGKTRQHYLKVIAGLLTASGMNRNTPATEVLRLLEVEGKQCDIDHRTLVATLRSLAPYR